MYTSGIDYAHSVEVPAPTRWLFLAGTMGLDERGEPGETLTDQLELVWANIREILAEAGMTVDNLVRVTSYLRDVSYVEENTAARMAALGGRRIPTTAIIVGTLDERWLVEIEAIAVA
jgi:enamine deaminase RidA (YjgF/YER057c/UK114 family)